MDFFSIVQLLGGLAVFLFGMNVMGDALEKRSGDRLKNVLESLTASPLKGLLLGMAVTAVIQSSSATTVMVVGFVNSGIMKLTQSIGVIMGANIGTTITAWLLSLTGISGDNFVLQLVKPTTFAPILAFFGIIFVMFSKNEKSKQNGTILLGFAVLMSGMESMSASVAPLADDPNFANILLMFNNPFLGLIVGALLTGIIQSSSASVGILQALTVTGSITYANAIPIVLGQNIGTTITALLSSIGTNRNARRTAVVHLAFNVIGSTLFLILFFMIKFFIPQELFMQPLNAAHIAIIHTVFNVFATAVLFPFTKQLEKIACLVIPITADEKGNENIALLDERLLQTPSLAIAHAKSVTDKMAKMAKESLLMAMDTISVYDREKIEKVQHNEEKVDLYEDKLGSYLIKLSRESLSVDESHEISNLLHSIGDFERMNDHAVNLCDVAQELHDKKIHFSNIASKEISVITAAITEILELTTQAFVKENLELAKQVEPLEQMIDRLRGKMKDRHISRMRNNECSIETGFIFSDLLNNYERIADHCSNVAVCLITVSNDGFDTHEYLAQVKGAYDADFQKEYEYYKQKYII